MKTLITAHRVTCTKAYRRDELGMGLSPQPWGENTSDYEGTSEPIVVELLRGATCEECDGGGRVIYAAGSEQGMSLPDAIALGLARVVRDGEAE